MKENPFSLKKDNERPADESPEGVRSKEEKKNITVLKISEFLLGFFESTQTNPRYEEVDPELDEMTDVTPGTSGGKESEKPREETQGNYTGTGGGEEEQQQGKGK